MKIAVIGSRTIFEANIEEHLSDCKEIVSGGAKGVDSLAAEYAKRKGIKLTVILPEYARYGKAAPIIRNRELVDYADKIIAFWDGCSKGTKHVIEYAKTQKKQCEIVLCDKRNSIHK